MLIYPDDPGAKPYGHWSRCRCECSHGSVTTDATLLSVKVGAQMGRNSGIGQIPDIEILWSAAGGDLV